MFYSVPKSVQGATAALGREGPGGGERGGVGGAVPTDGGPGDAGGRHEAHISAQQVEIVVQNNHMYRGRLYVAQNTTKHYPGTARQNSLATAGTNLTKPGAQKKVDLCI